MSLVYHEDTKRLGLTIEDKEIDITDQLKEKGVYTQDYTFEGEERRLTVTGTPEDPKLTCCANLFRCICKLRKGKNPLLLLVGRLSAKR